MIDSKEKQLQKKLENAFKSSFHKLNKNHWEKNYYETQDIGIAYNYFEVFKVYNDYIIRISVNMKERYLNFKIDGWHNSKNYFKSQNMIITIDNVVFSKYIYSLCKAIDNFFEKFTWFNTK